MLLIQGRIRIPTDRVEAAREPLRRVIEATRQEAGCRLYSFAQDCLDPTLFHIVERWESREALKAHAASAHIAAWRAAGGELGVHDRDIRVFEVEGEGEPV